MEEVVVNFAQIAAVVTVEAVLFAAALGLLYRLYGRIFAVPTRVVVGAFEQGVVLRGSSVEKVLAPGRYWMTPRRSLMRVDMRPKPLQIPAQELIALDEARIRVSLGGELKILDPARFVAESSDAAGAFYLELRQALRMAATELPSEAILGSQSLLTARVGDLLIPRAAQLGVELTRLDVWQVVLVGWPHPA